MRRRPLATLLLWSICVSAALPFGLVGAADRTPAARELHDLFEAEWERGLRENPVSATYIGDARYNDAWPDYSPAALQASHEADQAALARLERIAPAQLSADDRLNRDLFRRQTQANLDTYEYGSHYVPLSHRSGLTSMHRLADVVVFRTVKDYEQWLARMNTFDRVIDQNVDMMRAGVKRGLVPPRILIQRLPKQIDQQLVTDAMQSPFYAVFADIPDAIPAADRTRLQAAARAAIDTRIVPAYARLKRYVEGEYLAACRESVGLWDTPNGAARYAELARFYTTTDLTPDQIHDIGLKEVARIRAEMIKVIARTGFEGGFDAFLAHLRTDPKFRYTDPKELLVAYEAMAKRVDPLLPQYFGKLPRMPYGVRPIAEQIAPDTTTAYYQGPAMDGSRAGYYYVNLYKPEERPKYEIPVLTIHEAVPGHHLQIALAQELGELPKFRRDFEATAYVEGWGLYAESLGEEMGFYEDPYDKFGQLTYEMWRAVRLVVDTGLHHKRWSRQQAIDYFKANAAKTELDIVNEIDRYIGNPGQALAYKIGELRIRELRREATERLGERFDLRAFHDVVLGSGAIPLDVLSANVRRWIDASGTPPAPAAR
jgi:prolyl oligopeptidase